MTNKIQQDDWIFEAEITGSLWDNLMLKGFSKNIAASLCKLNLISINNTNLNSRDQVVKGSNIKVQFPTENIDHKPCNYPLDIVYEDADIMVVNKPKGLTVNSKGVVSLANALAYYYEKNGLQRKIRFISRLDMDTQGLLMIAKNAVAQNYYQQAMANDEVHKYYMTIVDGNLTGTGTLDFKIGACEGGIGYEVRADGKETLTQYESMDQVKGLDNCTKVMIKLLTGKTHQIRVSFSHIGHPLTGDKLYGGSSQLDTFELVAFKLCFKHMRTDENITLQI